MRNAASTIVQTLDGIQKQKYQIQEVIIVDNASTDNSVSMVKAYSKKYPKFKISLLVNKTDMMIARNIARGVREVKTPYVMLSHADCVLESPREIATLTMPFNKDPDVIATYGYIKNPLTIWKQYPFWEKCLFAHEAGKTVPGLTGKIDCFNKKVLLATGHDEKRYDKYGGEDADLYLHLRKKGKIVLTTATTIHLHYLDHDFSFQDLLAKKNQTAHAYGRLLRIHGWENGLWGIFAMLLKPVLAIGSLIPVINYVFVPALILFPFLYYRRVFMTSEAFLDARILALPFVGVFLVYLETYWFLEGFFSKTTYSTYAQKA